MDTSDTKKKRGLLEGFLRNVEIMGNKIPHPMLLFIYLCIATIVISAVCSMLHVSAVNPVSGETVEVVNLFSKDAGDVKRFHRFFCHSYLVNGVSVQK